MISTHNIHIKLSCVVQYNIEYQPSLDIASFLVFFKKLIFFPVDPCVRCSNNTLRCDLTEQSPNQTENTTFTCVCQPGFEGLLCESGGKFIIFTSKQYFKIRILPISHNIEFKMRKWFQHLKFKETMDI